MILNDLFYVLIAVCLVSVQAQTWQQNGTNRYRGSKAQGLEEGKPPFSRIGRFLSLFTYVQFDNRQCGGSSGETGTCLAVGDCQKRGGTSIGTCATGYGVCCLITARCGGIIKENGTVFVNPGYPEPYDEVGSCQVTVLKKDAAVCQYRLDFDILDIMGPESINHLCINDQLTVSGGNPSVPVICGQNDGSHIYIEVQEGYNVDPVTISITTIGGDFQRSWKIRVTYIPCSSITKAQGGCLQYYTGVAGQIRSFNYNLTSGRQLSNQDYTICVRTERHFCGIQYSQCMDDVNSRNQSFTLSGNSNQAVPSMVGSTGNTNFCPNDYVIIPMASNVDRIGQGRYSSVDRICGGVFSADIRQTPATVSSMYCFSNDKGLFSQGELSK